MTVTVTGGAGAPAKPINAREPKLYAVTFEPVAGVSLARGLLVAAVQSTLAAMGVPAPRRTLDACAGSQACAGSRALARWSGVGLVGWASPCREVGPGRLHAAEAS